VQAASTGIPRKKRRPTEESASSAPLLKRSRTSNGPVRRMSGTGLSATDAIELLEDDDDDDGGIEAPESISVASTDLAMKKKKKKSQDGNITSEPMLKDKSSNTVTREPQSVPSNQRAPILSTQLPLANTSVASVPLHSAAASSSGSQARVRPSFSSFASQPRPSLRDLAAHKPQTASVSSSNPSISSSVSQKRQRPSESTVQNPSSNTLSKNPTEARRVRFGASPASPSSPTAETVNQATEVSLNDQCGTSNASTYRVSSKRRCLTADR
jgi:hypothetical protein